MREPNRERKGEIKYSIALNDEQKEAKKLIYDNQIVIITGQAGCLTYGTKILMYDGIFKEVQDIIVGDQLMGIDSSPRNVLSLCRGNDQMYWIRQNNGKDYRVNQNHILSLMRNIPIRYHRKTNSDRKRYFDRTIEPIFGKKTTIENITIKDYLDLPNKKQYKGYIAPLLYFDNKKVLIDPYYLGLHLGDGNTDNLGITSMDKEIQEYILNYHKSIKLKTRVDKQKNSKATYFYPKSIYNNTQENMSIIKHLYEKFPTEKNISKLSRYVKEKFGKNYIGLKRSYRKFLNIENKKDFLDAIVDKNCSECNILSYYFKQYNLFKNKQIPKDYIFNSKKIRLEILAGIIDSDGYLSKKGKYYDIILKSEQLSNDITFLARTLGFKVNQRSKLSKMKRKDSTIYTCKTYRITISGHNIYEIPIKLQRKKLSKEDISHFKNRRCTGISIEKDVIDDYYGFILDGDNLFILEDFTVTHNSGKTTINAQCALDFLNKKMIDNVFLCRPFIEVGKSLGYLPGDLNQKSNPYFEAFIENVYKCSNDRDKVKQWIEDGRFIYLPIQYIRGRTIDDYLFLDEAQSTSPHEMEAILTRLGKNGKLIICGDLAQKDTNIEYDGLSYALDLAKRIPEIKHIKLHSNHRSNLVQKILEVTLSLKRK